MLLRIVDSSLRTRCLQTRLPFKFGVQVLSEVTLAELHLTLEYDESKRVVGRASDLLVPKWFKKDPNSTTHQDALALQESVEAAASLVQSFGRQVGAHPIFDTWLTAYRELVSPSEAADQLVAGFGTSMVERAMIDGVCRAANCSFHDALTQDLFGFQSHRLLPETKGWSAQSLPPLRETIALRHTIGMLDPLEGSEISKEDRVDDGLPQALDEDIERYGLKWFKIKICGDSKKDAERLQAIASVVMPRVGDDARFTLDGNEQCLDMAEVAAMLSNLQRDPIAGSLIERIALIEQPLPRASTFDRNANNALESLSAIAPVIIDEADASIDSFKQAIDLGYAGVSIKACKGVFRAIANRALLDTRSNAFLFQSGEDLTNLGSIPLQQDLALQASLGMHHVERNGHHYFNGLAHLSNKACRDLMEDVPGLYEPLNDSATLAVQNGRLDLTGFIHQPGFGGTLASVENE